MARRTSRRKTASGTTSTGIRVFGISKESSVFNTAVRKEMARSKRRRFMKRKS